MTPPRKKDTDSTRLLRRMKGGLFRASRLLERGDNRWRRRNALDGLVAHGERIASGEILRVVARLPYREGRSPGGLVYPARRPLRADLATMSELSDCPELSKTTPARIAVIDLETTGLLDRGETVAFLVGIGHYGSRQFVVEQYFLEDFESEPVLLEILESRMKRYEACLTYNGKVFDLPLLRRRSRIHGIAETAWRLPHWDVLPSTRRLWRGRASGCSLIELEEQVFGFVREKAIEENRIPQVYHDYLGATRSERLAAVFDHNAQDILTTAAVAVALAREKRGQVI